MQVLIDNVGGLPALIVEPETKQCDSTVLLFLHGKGEAGSTPNEIPMVCLHQTPPFQAMLGRLPGTTVVAPQAPPIPSKDEWNWAEHLNALVEFFCSEPFMGRRLVATGFSRGGLGVLQLVSAAPNLISSWAVVDPQPPRNEEEARTLLNSPAMGDRGWVRYGVYRTRSAAWQKFSSDLATKIPPENYDITELSHPEMALRAYNGSALSKSPKSSLYRFTSLEFPEPAIERGRENQTRHE